LIKGVLSTFTNNTSANGVAKKLNYRDPLQLKIEFQRKSIARRICCKIKSLRDYWTNQ
jgi:hypothetical protein